MVAAGVLAPFLEDPFFQVARNIALHHHEKWDGSGYPQGLSGDGIPKEAQVAALADVFDALTSKRSYRKRSSAADAVAYLREHANVLFDAEIVASLAGDSVATVLILRDFALRASDDSHFINEVFFPRWMDYTYALINGSIVSVGDVYGDYEIMKVEFGTAVLRNRKTNEQKILQFFYYEE